MQNKIFKHRNNISHIYLLILLLLAISNINYAASVNLIPSNVFNFYCLIFLVLISTLILRDEKFRWLFVPYLFGIFGGLLPCYVLELSSSYLIETQQYTQLTGVTARGSSLCSIFLISTYLFLTILQAHPQTGFKRIYELDGIEFKVLKAALFISILYLLSSLLISGTPLITGMPRFNYFKELAFPGFRFFYTLIPFFSLLLSLSYVRKIISLRNLFFFMLILVTIPILTNEKFSLYLDIYFYFLVPLIYHQKVVLNKKFIFISIAFICCMFLIAAMKYLQSGHDLSYILVRISLQAEMIYALDLVSTGARSFSFINFYDSFLGFSSDIENIGMYHLMNQIVPSDYVSRLAGFNQSFTMPFPSNFIYFFTVEFAPFAIMIFSIPVAFSIYFFYKTILSTSLFLTFVAATFFHYMTIATMMGKTERLFHPITLSCFFILLLILILGSNNKKSSTNYG